MDCGLGTVYFMFSSPAPAKTNVGYSNKAPKTLQVSNKGSAFSLVVSRFAPPWAEKSSRSRFRETRKAVGGFVQVPQRSVATVGLRWQVAHNVLVFLRSVYLHMSLLAQLRTFGYTKGKRVRVTKIA